MIVFTDKIIYGFIIMRFAVKTRTKCALRTGSYYNSAIFVCIVLSIFRVQQTNTKYQQQAFLNKH